MLSNLHTHTVFCDGENTPEELVLSAIEKGFVSLGFSGHGFTDFGEPFGVDDMEGYLINLKTLKEKYKSKIQIYIGIEEDALKPLKNRKDFDYIIGSHHYIKYEEKVIPIDLSFAEYKKCISLFNNIEEFAENYYKTFCDYILNYRPTIIGHFDLITKFDERDGNYLLNNKAYNNIAEKYVKTALKADSFFEVNTGAMARGYRTTPYPFENLLYNIKKADGRLIISSDAHSAENLNYGFDETKLLLKEIGFEYTYLLYNNEFIKQEL